ncbi:hypothetical protein BC835DRAFT_582229 [Cytidiella melzeri]|nr:hypothetical protein BC835DRAFT_582229 [Cytidiella melzeri]
MSLIVNYFTSDQHNDETERVIRHGRDVLRLARVEDGWLDVYPPSHSDLVCFQAKGIAYEYAHKAPRIETTSPDQDILEFDASKTVDEEIFHVEDLEEFQHGVVIKEPVHGIDPKDKNSLLRFSTQDFSSFLRQHQPDAQSTPFFPAPAESPPPSIDLQVPPNLVSLPFVESSVSNALRVSEGALVEHASFSNLDAYSEPEESVAKNHSAFNPPSEWSAEEPSSHRLACKSANTFSSTSQKASETSLARIEARQSNGPFTAADRPSRGLESIPRLASAVSLPSPPPAQPPRDVSDPRTESQEPSAIRHTPSWHVQDYMTSLYTQNPLFSHVVPEAQPRSSGSPKIFESFESPVREYPEPGREAESMASYQESVFDFTRSRSPSVAYSDHQPSAYQQQQNGIFFPYPSATPDKSLPSQPSAYRAASPPADSMARILPPSLITKSPRSVRPRPSPSLEPMEPIVEKPLFPHVTHQEHDATASLVIPGLDALPPFSSPPVQHEPVAPRVTLDVPIPSIPTSSPIQDVTSAMSIHAMTSLPRTPNDNRWRKTAVVGPRWKFIGLGQDKHMKDAAPSSPIQDFTSLEQICGGIQIIT